MILAPHLLTVLLSLPLLFSSAHADPIDRHALVTRHNVTLTAFDGQSPLQVGNGHFAFGMDVTGLQTFAPFNTLSDWGWNSSPLPEGVKISDYHEQIWETHGRPVPYPLPDPAHPEISTWLAGNPHRINLGRVGLRLTKKDGSEATAADLQNPRQTLDLWSGIVTSRFELEGIPITVVTACHPSKDEVAAQVESPLVKEGRLMVFLECPQDDGAQFANFVGDSSHFASLEVLPSPASHRADLLRPLGKDSYRIAMTWGGDAKFLAPPMEALSLKIVKAEYGANETWENVTSLLSSEVKQGRLAVHIDNRQFGDPVPRIGKTLKVVYETAGKQLTVIVPENGDLVIDPTATQRRYLLKPASNTDSFSFAVTFSPKPIPARLPTTTATIAASRRNWPAFWKSGGAIDLSESRDPRWKELERRIVLSQYLMATNEAESFPPQESGLVNNGWFGRFHMEMYWWHAAHWALWNRWNELDRSLGIYQKLLTGAKLTASKEGYLGARWPKCIGPNGREWPHPIHSFLIWQQPHPIFFAELDYRAHPTRSTLKKWQPIVEATADFMASYAYYDKSSGRYDLGPPLAPVSENTDFAVTKNPTFELGYWRFGLRTASEWRKREGLPPNPLWEKVLKNLAPLPEDQGAYVLYEGVKDMWTHWNFEHPALTGVYGILPGDGVNPATMRNTLDKVEATWDFNHTWGWDFPMLAMCAARLGEPEKAVDFLMTNSPGFQFDARGLATGGPFPYFPSNGGLLYAVAMMAAGWQGSQGSAPGFPGDGMWKVRSENLSSAP
jgi:hypothetical protein